MRLRIRPQCFDNPVALVRGKASELRHDLLARHGIDHRRRCHGNGAETVEIGLAGFEIIIEPLAHPMRTRDMFDEFEWTRTHHGFDRIGWIGLEFFRAENGIPR